MKFSFKFSIIHYRIFINTCIISLALFKKRIKAELDEYKTNKNIGVQMKN